MCETKYFEEPNSCRKSNITIKISGIANLVAQPEMGQGIVGSNQSCSVSKETIDLIVTRGTLWSNNLFKNANIIILCRTKVSLW